MAVTATLRAELTGSQTNVLDQGTGAFPFSLLSTLSFTDGAGANQVNQVFADTRTLALSATEDLDLAGVLSNAFGTTVAFARIKAILIKAAAGNTNDVVVGAATAPFLGPLAGTTPTVAVPPGGVFLVANPSAAGWVVTATTADVLKITNGGAGTAVTYDILVLGSLT